jgi:hypothetical protein
MEIYVSKLKAAKFFSLGLIGTLASAFVFWKVFSALMFYFQHFSPAFIIGIFCSLIFVIVAILGIFMFGSAMLIFGKRILTRTPLVLINSEGIEDKRLNLGLISWSEITSIFPHKVESIDSLLFSVKLPEKYINKLPFFTKLIRKINGDSDLNEFKIYFTELDKPIEEALNYILNVKFDNVTCKKFRM